MKNKSFIYIFLIIFAILTCNCQYAPVKSTEVRKILRSDNQIDTAITVGVFIDNRFSFWPRKEQNAPIVQEGMRMAKEFEPMPGMKEVRIPMGDVRSKLAYTLKESRSFKEIINPPTQLVGESLAQMFEKSLESSDYLVVGEVNRFHIRDLGRNTTSAITIPIDLTFLFLPNLVVYPLSQGKSFFLTGNAFKTRTAECVLSMSITIYAVETGNPITTFRVEEKSMRPVDAVDVYGDFYNDEDDWIDISRELGEVALANACTKALDKVIEAIRRSKDL